MYNKLKDHEPCDYPKKCSNAKNLKAPPKKVKRVVSEHMKNLASILRHYLNNPDDFDIEVFSNVELKHFPQEIQEDSDVDDQFST
jgi:hypothetical protein